MARLSAKQLDDELKLRKNGEREGKQNLPSPEATSLSDTERAIVTRVEGASAQSMKSLLGLGSADEFSTLSQDLETLASEPQTVLAKFRAEKLRAQKSVQTELTNAHSDFERADRDYKTFRKQHGLTTTEPTYDNVFWRKVFLLALMFVIEVVANGWVIGEASPGGLVQGWATALMISTLVVLTGTLIGMGPWRYLNYRGAHGNGRVHLLWALPAVLLGCASLVFFAFYVAHYRFALSTTSIDAPAPSNILSAIAADPFAPFQQLESLVLFVIATLIGVFAIVRGARWDDPYPGYGVRHRKLEVARERSQESTGSLSQQVDAAKAQADAAMNALAAKSQETINGLRNALSKAQDNASVWDGAAADLISAGRDALDAYRSANRAARSAREPDYFRDDPFRGRIAPSSATIIAGLDSALRNAASSITQCKSQLAGARAQLEAEYHSFYDDELSPFLRGVAVDAANSVRNEFADIDVEPASSRAPAKTPRAEKQPRLEKRGADKNEMFDDSDDDADTVVPMKRGTRR